MAPISPNRMNWKMRNFSGPHEETVGNTYAMRNDGNDIRMDRIVIRVTFLDRVKINLCLHMETFEIYN